MSENDGLLIGELAELSGVTAEAIRYYEREGVIPQAKRGGSGKYRRYDRRDADRLRFVRRARELGFSLDDVRELLGLAASDPAQPCGDVDELVRSHIAGIDAKLAHLSALRTELSRLVAGCDSRSKIGQCSLLNALSS